MRRGLQLIRLIGAALLVTATPALADRVAGTNAQATNLTHTAATFSASITTDDAGTGSYSLAFFYRATSASAFAGLFATPSSVPVNGNATTTFAATVGGLECGQSYIVTGAFLIPGETQYRRAGTGDSTFTTLPCATLSPTSVSVKFFTGQLITPITFAAANFNGTPTFRIAPELPTGLSFSSTTATISGTPSAARSERQYTITGTGLISGTAVVSVSLTVAPTISDQQVLNYIASHSDLINAFGLDIAKARQHYLNWGFNEGRTISFAPLSYTASYSDLIAAFGTDERKAVEHFILFGSKEGRKVAFDPLRYIASHPDLIDAFKTDADKGVRHYINFGFKEGRGITFDPLRYLATHPDLITAFGGDESKALAHYINFGFKEKRQTSFSDLDALSYVASYGDLISAIATDVLASIRHYISVGFQQGRRIVFDALTYIASHADLIQAFGVDTLAAAKHYINWGFKEGRKVFFDALGYLAAHADLRAAFGTDTVAATKHYINWGFKEGREYLWTVTAFAGPGGSFSATRSFAKSGERVSLTVTPSSGYAIESVSGCGGALSGSVFTTGPVSGACAIQAQFKLLTISGTLTADCVGANCAAVNNTTYAGNGVGVWRYSNASANLPALVNVALSGVSSGKTVTLLFTNGGKVSAPGLPGAGVTASPLASPLPLRSTSFIQSLSDEPSQASEQAHARILESNRAIAAALQFGGGNAWATAFSAPPPQPAGASFTPAVGAERVWKDAAFGTTVDYPSTVRATCAAASGRTIVFWVDNETWKAEKVSAGLLERFTKAFCGEKGGYERLVKLQGEPWGPHSNSTLISDAPTLQDLNVVMVNSSEGYAGYFWGLNAIKDNPKSNNALAFIINARQFSGDNTSASLGNFYISTLVHELMHMVNFYQRAIKRSVSHDTWLEETSAMMSEDIITPALIGYNKIGVARLPDYVRTGGAVSYINWPQLSGPNYAIGGSFGAFMNRRYGLSFFTAVQACRSNSYDCVDSFINLNGGGSFANEFARMGASIFGLLPATGVPSLYGFPARTEGEYALSAIDVSALANSRPRSATPLASGYGATTHWYVADTVASGAASYVRNDVLVPVGTSLTVIVR